MFQIDPAGNRIEPLQRRSFPELGLGERVHLQEWIAGRPEALGEDLLVLGKEFALPGTRSRPDLLALDRSGRLVVIETKRDKPGRDVLWQAAHYAAHAAAMDGKAIISAHQRYLDRTGANRDACARIRDFLELGDARPLRLNPPRSQRIILVAGDFPKELGAAMLWLRDQGVALQCIRATPVTAASGLFLDFEQVIPGPEDAEYRPVATLFREPDTLPGKRIPEETAKHRRDFWNYVLPRMRAAGVPLFAHAASSSGSHVAVPTALAGVEFRLTVGQRCARVELRLGHQDRTRNDAIFQHLRARKAEIEASFGAHLNWGAPANRIVRTLAYPRSFDTRRRETWPAISLWLIEHAAKLHRATEPHLAAEQKFPAKS
ncbi:DUF4268 domain-containing protein [Poseidonocella sp. HB161398]|uniref:DUF4268 domain-containing protein n=1 Tax=Poseidonocella sp. HB161398 TaxID=2320855 RepID=UPI001486E74C|nr:DUF4268 domain-containing protein [Poseidonocella sp. HB161398]